jgi:hypothetical protein
MGYNCPIVKSFFLFDVSFTLSHQHMRTSVPISWPTRFAGQTRTSALFSYADTGRRVPSKKNLSRFG